MNLKEHVRKLIRDDEKLIEVSPFCYMRLMADGSAIMYKTTIMGLQQMMLSRHDLEYIKHMALPVPIFTPEPEENRDVHTEHCCVIHGCKYSKPDCTVTTDTKRQSHACESCHNDAEGFCGWREAPDPPVYVITKIIETCGACPAQWSARTDAGEYVYIRYRHGHLRIDVNDDTRLEEDFISEYGGDGCLSFEELQRRTEGFMDFNGAQWVESSDQI